jgi:predicted 3-demethylubiquinone-9 3-methyltransferase (glyoxalase superfamily)
MQKITTFMAFQSHGKEAVDFYTSIFKNSRINSLMALPETNQLIHASFVLDGEDFMAMDGGDNFKFEQGMSLFVSCEDQDEVDYYWEKLGQGGEYIKCGWLKDQFGLSWQIIPKRLNELMQDSDTKKTMKVRDAMLNMIKIDVEGLERAYNSIN